MKWPQITLLILIAIDFGITLVQHGKPRPDNYNIITSLIGRTILCTLLYFGGFFSG